MNVLILTNGEYGNYTFCKKYEQYDYIICADNGMKHARKLGIHPDEIMGDFDSCNLEDLSYFKNMGVSIKEVPCEKDETDTELALDRAISMGATKIHIWGGIGTRIDHSLANIHLLYKALKNNVEVILYSHNHKLVLIKDDITLNGEVGDLVSLIPFTPIVKGVTTKNLAYSLENAVFEIGKPYGVSNYMTGKVAEVHIAEGVLIVMQVKE